MKAGLIEFVEDCGRPGGAGICFTRDGILVDGGIWGLLIGLALLIACIALFALVIRRSLRFWRNDQR